MARENAPGAVARKCDDREGLPADARLLHAWRADRHAGNGDAADACWSGFNEAHDVIQGDVALDGKARDSRGVTGRQVERDA